MSPAPSAGERHYHRLGKLDRDPYAPGAVVTAAEIFRSRLQRLSSFRFDRGLGLSIRRYVVGQEAGMAPYTRAPAGILLVPA